MEKVCQHRKLGNTIYASLRISCLIPILLYGCTTKTGDKKMFLDFVPSSNNNIVLFSAGWAFQFTPIIGLACAELALERKTQFDVSSFDLPITVGNPPKLHREFAKTAQNRRLSF